MFQRMIATRVAVGVLHTCRGGIASTAPAKICRVHLLLLSMSIYALEPQPQQLFDITLSDLPTVALISL